MNANIKKININSSCMDIFLNDKCPLTDQFIQILSKRNLGILFFCITFSNKVMIFSSFRNIMNSLSKRANFWFNNHSFIFVYVLKYVSYFMNSLIRDDKII